MRIKVYILLSLSLFFLHSCKKEPVGDLTEVPQVNIKTILTGYEIIWGMDFLPNGDLIFGEKRGKLYRKNNETITEISGLPEDSRGRRPYKFWWCKFRK